MNTRVKLIGVLISAVPLVGLAQGQAQGEHKLSCIKDITYSEEFLARYPRAGAACREVQMRNGEKWVRFEAEIAGVKGDEITTNFIDEFKNPISTIVFKANPGAKLNINGTEVDFDHLKPGDKLDLWWPQSKLGFYSSQPGSSNMKKLVEVSNVPAKQ
jgi:hypothetical protein